MSGKLETKGLGRAGGHIRSAGDDTKPGVFVTDGLPDPEEVFRKVAGIKKSQPIEPTPSLREALRMDDTGTMERAMADGRVGGAAQGLKESVFVRGGDGNNGMKAVGAKLRDAARRVSSFYARNGQSDRAKPSIARRSTTSLRQLAQMGNRSAHAKSVTPKFRESARRSLRLITHESKSPLLTKLTIAETRLASSAHVFSVRQILAQLTGMSSVSMSGIMLSKAVQKDAVRKSVIRVDVIRAAKQQSVMCRLIMRGQHRMALRGASAVKRSMHRRALEKAIGSKKQVPSRRGAGQRHSVFVVPQQAQLLAVFRAQAATSRSRSSGEGDVSVQNVSAKAKQSSMTTGVAAQQTQSTLQTKAAAPFISSRTPVTPGLRSQGKINPALACPVPVMQEQNGRILSPHVWIDGSLYELIEHIDPEIADAFFDCLLEQLQKGPASLAKDDMRKKANECLEKGTPSINAMTWVAMLQEVLLQAVHHVKIFDDTGIRGSAAVRVDAAMLLDLDVELYTSWEDSFCMNSIAWNLYTDNIAPIEERFVKHKDVMLSVEQKIIRRSSEAFAQDDYQSVLLHTFETKVQWKAVRCCALENNEQKVVSTVDMIIQLAKKDRPAVARMMTIIVRHSSINKRKMAKDIFVPRWNLDDLRYLIIKLTKEHVSVLSDNYFRSQLTAWENASLNNLIMDANHEHAKARMKKLSPKQPYQDFVDLLEKYDQEDEVLHDIWEDIARNFSKMN